MTKGACNCYGGYDALNGLLLNLDYLFLIVVFLLQIISEWVCQT